MTETTATNCRPLLEHNFAQQVQHGWNTTDKYFEMLLA